ncbi:MAG TPA: hypothetical protein VFE52_05505 [Devosia sp.]|nr:hypothetical protein [Devosia sp.]
MSRALTWSHGVVSVQSLGGMIGPTLFLLPDGRQIAPFQVAPWASEGDGEELPGILKRLRGEWPCVPFGSDDDRLPAGEWPGSSAVGTVDPSPHGFSSNNHWQFDSARGDGIALAIRYPEDHPIASLERSITPDPNGPALDIELVVHVRHDCVLPIGLHPCFRLPQRTVAMRIELPAQLGAATFPVAVDESSIFAQGQFIDAWNNVPLLSGDHLDVSRAPLPRDTEEILQVLDVPGTASLWNTAEGYRVRLSWDPEHFPSVLLWFSNRGRQMPPWSGRHLALGVEPICAAFDLGQQISAADNPLTRRGTPTARAFRAGERFATRYRVEVAPADIL